MDNFDHEELPFGNFDDVPDFGRNEEQGKEEGKKTEEAIV